jgi:hypothetical protein
VKSRNDAWKLVAAIVVIAALITLTVIALKSKDGSTVTKGALVYTRTPTNAAANLPGAATIATGDTDSRGGLTPLPVDQSAPDAPAPPNNNPSAPGGPVAPQLTCPAPLPPATHTGGVANLTAIIPAFGPYSAEAFTFLPAFEPAFPVLGPLFPVFEAMLAAGQPLLDASLPVLNSFEQSGYDALAPLYTPVRPQILAGEAQAAAAFNPLMAQLAATDGSGCVADVADIVAGVVLGAF